MTGLTSLVLICSILGFFALAGGSSASDDLDTVTVTGSTTVMPLVEICAEEFNMLQDEVMVTVSGVGGSGVGIKNVASGFSDIGMSSRELRADEIELYGDNFSEYLIGYDAICIAVSKSIYDAGVTNISRSQLREIYNGNVTNWRELGGPERDIYAVARMVGSGTGDLFNEMVMGDLETETLGADTYTQNNAEMKTAITKNDKAIGYLGFNYVQDGNLSAVAYEGVFPTTESIKSDAYPLSRPLYVMTWNEPDSGEEAFIEFLLGDEGQSIVEEIGFLPVG
ncbi:MAG: phosphate ABC transporter substrate-binding protein [Methanothrix sp.]|jgi:phosphate transport system substrate-binding protein|uniref:Phosphate ABC transporter substrate-binding protein, PhoT family n=1 Tax=Methanothrix harundinacea TaxID=301375 RepID=A0A101IJE5_9EURY|nr:MAG: Phosphate ABC transporter substrate-binding protein, PhoT family [Methanothrix harundinacea]MDD2638364.1 phosphate ABC transporter substrate-binding protein [Methanothrix sp.]MDI9399536.1 phosphate ABC transporter substrate-binding protein [Euryarchaeota archaeon]KUK96244.1 MAG: Phosphate ABC transporter substrate-binding protein, PhoT family [Methanothrix harundinacea]MCP1393281.1 phosphate ABC transporter substrate-binding protein [Methanothrix harundinacea]